MSASDACGLVDSIYNALRIVFVPDDLSVILSEAEAATRSSSLHYNDSPCLPLSVWSLNSFANMVRNKLGPVNPVLAAPSRLLAYDPEWSNYVADMYQGYDTPIAMTPSAALVPSLNRAKYDPKQ